VRSFRTPGFARGASGETEVPTSMVSIRKCSLHTRHRNDPAMKFKAIIHEAEKGGFWAEVPTLPGCVTQWDTMAELELNLREAIEGWLAAGQDELSASSNEQILQLAI